jgi:tRNA1Val (adenine37-N6)-methyltransferase
MESSFTLDSISLRGAGVLSVMQQKKGARFTLDSLLLADFCRVKDRDSILEPGAGTGIVSLLLAKKHPCCRIFAVEQQPALAELCRLNGENNNLEGRVTVIKGDLRTLDKNLKKSSFDLIVANPPYTKTGSGKRSPLHERLASRQDVLGDLDAWLALQRHLKNKGRYVLVYPASRLADLVASLRSHRLEPKRMRLVHPFSDKPASVVLVESVKSAGTELQVLPPLVIHHQGGAYTAEMRDLYALPAFSAGQ